MSHEDLPLFAETAPSVKRQATIVCDDVLAWAEKYDGPPFSAMISDPPYSLKFMNKSWDNDIAFKADTWKALAQHLLPGAFGMCFASSRGFHRLMVAIEDAGLMIHPAIFNYRSGEMLEVPSLYGWSQGAGFPKATRIDTQIDEMSGIDVQHGKGFVTAGVGARLDLIGTNGHGPVSHQAQTKIAQAWAGHRYGLQALKPSIEPVIVFTKPGICYNELQDVVADISLLLEDLWSRFADTAETITKAESIVASVLMRVETTIGKAEAPISVDVAGKNLPDDQQKSEKVVVLTAQKNARMRLQDNGSTVTTVEPLSIKTHQLFNQPNIDSAADHAIHPTSNSIDSESASTVGSHLLQIGQIEIENIAPMTADTPQDTDPCSKIHCEMATDTDIRMAILRYNSERAKFDLSTIWLWSITWDALWSEENKSTTETSEKTITRLRTLSSALRRLMLVSRDTASKKSLSTNLWSYASDVNSHFIGLLTSLTVQQPSANHASLRPIIVFQKPYAGKPVESITQTGAGALWIDGARVGVGAQWWERGDAPPDEATALMQGVHGRWPGNFAICHADGCIRVGERQVKGSSGGSFQREMTSRGYEGGGLGQRRAVDHMPRDLEKPGYADATGNETVAAYRCTPGCPVAALDAQAGERRSSGNIHRSDSNRAGPGVIYHPMQSRALPGVNTYSDKGSASRFFHVSDWSLDIAERLAQANPVFYSAKSSRRERSTGLPDGERNNHPCCKPLTLCKWLASLLAPPAAYAPRRLLVPFSGSGSEMCGAILSQGFEEIIGIDSDAGYCNIARQRVTYWQQRGKL